VGVRGVGVAMVDGDGVCFGVGWRMVWAGRWGGGVGVGGGGGGGVGGWCEGFCGLVVGGVGGLFGWVCVGGGFICGMPGGLEGKPCGVLLVFEWCVARVLAEVAALLVVVEIPGGGVKVDASCGVNCRGGCCVIERSSCVSSKLVMKASMSLSVRWLRTFWTCCWKL
jgi:hypothetical protein